MRFQATIYFTMPRQLHYINLSTSAAEFKANRVPGVAFLLFCAFALFACISHSRKWQRLISKRWRSSDPVISIQQIQPGTGEVGEICIWQKGILMGEKCQLPDFSGVIAYDSEGKPIAPGQPRLANAPFK